jgi:probable F420-dependent oxidoreductase
MEIGIFLPTFGPGNDPEMLRVLAQTAESVGAAALWAPEHVVLVDSYESEYPYSDDGRFPIDPSSGGLGDPFAVLTFLAGLTMRVRLGTGICLVPQRNPVYTAKLVANLDLLSGGRFDFGIGVGWLAEEFAAVAAPFAKRAQRTRAYLEIMRRLWTEDVASHESEFYTLPPVRFAPKPVQKPHPPIIVGGESDPALRRVAEYGQGWIGWNVTPEVTAERIVFLDRLLAERGRKRRDLKMVVSPYTLPTRDLDSMKRYRDAGADQVILLLPLTDKADDIRAALEWLGNEIIAPAARL